MEVDVLFKIAAVGIIVAILNQVLSRSGRDEYTMITTLAGLIIVLMMLIQKILLKRVVLSEFEMYRSL